MSMDRPITSSHPWLKPVIALLLLGPLLFWLVQYLSSFSSAQTQLRLARQQLQIATVQAGDFERYVPARGSVESTSTIVLAALVSGQVQAIYAQAGAQLQRGDPILQLSNPQLQFDVLAVEGELFQQSNQLLSTELLLNQSIADNQQRLEDIQYRIATLSVALERDQELQRKGLAQRASSEDMQRELEYQRELLTITRAITAQNQQMRSTQLSELKTAESRLQERLSITTQLLDQLLVRAPIDGELIALDAKLGELKATGAELGSMISAGELHISSQIDEFYSSQIEVGGSATLTVDGQELSLQISRIYPQVEAGKLKLELHFTTPPPAQLKINQSFPLRLHLGANSSGLWLANGAFMNDSNGHWVYRLSEDGHSAQRHDVRIGARNPQQVEIISGLNVGDQVIISSYRDLGDADRLIIE